MCRTLALGSSLVVLAVLLAAGGCGSPRTKEPPKSPPSPAATQEKTSEAESPAAAQEKTSEAESPEGLKELSAEDRAAAEKQRVCPVSDGLLGTMGKPYKITVQDQTVFLCCQGCEEQFRKNPEKYFAKMKK